jgi:hypothetical protein
MSHLDILLPFSLPPTELATDLLRECKNPAFATLLARAKVYRTEYFDAFSRSLPHELWLARQFGLELAAPQPNSLSVATLLMQCYGLPVVNGTWFIIQPVHFHIARDHLVLTDVWQLDITEAESRALFAAAEPLFKEMGKSLVFGDATTWFVQADDWQDLQTSSPHAACGHNIDIWMPQGSAALSWRKLQNEVQMQWYADPVNAAREARSAKPVNSIWLWGGAVMPPPALSAPYTDVFGLTHWMQGLGATAGKQADNINAAELIDSTPDRGLLALDNLISPALSGDWSTWLEQMHRLEVEWFAPLLAALKSNALQELRLILNHTTQLAELRVTKAALHKFWVKPSLARLLS